MFLCVFLIEKKKKKIGDLPFQKRSKLTRLSFQKDRKKKRRPVIIIMMIIIIKLRRTWFRKKKKKT